MHALPSSGSLIAEAAEDVECARLPDIAIRRALRFMDCAGGIMEFLVPAAGPSHCLIQIWVRVRVAVARTETIPAESLALNVPTELPSNLIASRNSLNRLHEHRYALHFLGTVAAFLQITVRGATLPSGRQIVRRFTDAS